MKRWIGMGVFALLMFAGCKSVNGPGEALENYLTAMQKGDYEAFASGLSYSGFSAVNADSLTAHLLEANKQHLDERYGGLQSFEIVKVVLGDGGKTATVRVKLNLGNGQSEETEYEMIQVDKHWKINLGV